ncbi:hypothetical protein M758_10G184900, partial [Ceratodon purpureus]
RKYLIKRRTVINIPVQLFRNQTISKYKVKRLLLKKNRKHIRQHIDVPPILMILEKDNIQCRPKLHRTFEYSLKLCLCCILIPIFAYARMTRLPKLTRLHKSNSFKHS